MVDITKFPRGVPGRDLRHNIAPFAEWVNPQIIAEKWKFTHGRIFLGALGNTPIGVTDDRHAMTIAGSRAGKGASTIIPNLIFYPGSILVVDPKGENARVTAGRRGKGSKSVKETLGQHVHVLDPFGVSGYSTDHFNPLEMIEPASDTAVDDAALIADSIIIQATGEGRHWTSAARNFLRGIILFACVDPDAARRNLIAVRRYLTGDRGYQDRLLSAMAALPDTSGASDGCYEVIRRSATTMAAKDERERAGVISTAIEQTDFLDSPAMARCLCTSDFTLADLKRTPTTLYLCLPAGRMATHNRWLRIIINLAVEAMERDHTKPPHPVLFLMDEFAVLEHMASIEKAAGQIAGFGVRLWPILQDLSQLKSIYKEGWETFLGNAGLLQFFGNNDLTTLEYLARRIGKTTIQQITKGEISVEQSAGGFTGESVQSNLTELMTSDEISRYFSRQTRSQLLLWPGQGPIAIDRVQYFEHPWFQGMFDP